MKILIQRKEVEGATDYTFIDIRDLLRISIFEHFIEITTKDFLKGIKISKKDTVIPEDSTYEEIAESILMAAKYGYLDIVLDLKDFRNWRSKIRAIM